MDHFGVAAVVTVDATAGSGAVGDERVRAFGGQTIPHTQAMQDRRKEIFYDPWLRQIIHISQAILPEEAGGRMQIAHVVRAGRRDNPFCE